ncbi:MAG: S8 family peptidase [Fuerstiella sp.]
MPPGIPLLLQVDTELDVDDLRHYFDFEIVSEEEEGFVIVASSDVDLSDFLDAVNRFASTNTQDQRGTATIASVHRLDDDANQKKRLELILSEQLHELWPNLNEATNYRVDVGVACVGIEDIPKRPKQPKRRDSESDESWARRESHWTVRENVWQQARTKAYDAWHDLKDEREDEVQAIVEGYGGTIADVIYQEPQDAPSLPDSFTMRIEVNGKALKDFVLNFPFVFEVTEPDDVTVPSYDMDAGPQPGELQEPNAPNEWAPAVCVIDSGIQEGHILIEPAIDKSTSRCFLPPPEASTDVADYVSPGGHGTRVAGAILYGERVGRNSAYDLPFWIQNARVLDEDGCMPMSLFPATLIGTVIEHFHNGPRKTRIFNHSINADCHCRITHMSAWAAAIDWLCYELDVLIIQSSGNIPETSTVPSAGIREHLNAGRQYPTFLTERSSRVANPGQSLQAITVGSVAYQHYQSTGWRSFASQEAEPSSFSRSGLGIWNVIKPEVVEFGGDYLRSPGTPLVLNIPNEGSDCYPELVRSTLLGPGPAYDKDDIGTSYAAPKVTHIAAHLQRVLPDEPCLLYRALIIQSARWPEWTRTEGVDTNLAIRTLGFGIPDLERATTNTNYRTTLVSSGETGISAGECDVYQVPIPDTMRSPGYEYNILIEVTLSYVAQPRRTRRNLRRYLSTWLEWKSSNLGEDIDSFRARALKNESADDTLARGTSIPWALNIQSNHGTIDGVGRKSGTVQKDWAIVKSSSLPENFCVAVMGHKGWSKDPDSQAKYSMAVSFEIVDRQIEIYDAMRIAVGELQNELEVQTEFELEIED